MQSTTNCMTALMPDEFRNAEGWWHLEQPPRECEDEFHSTLEDWIMVGLKSGRLLPVIAEINLNKDLTYEPVEAL